MARIRRQTPTAPAPLGAVAAVAAIALTASLVLLLATPARGVRAPQTLDEAADALRERPVYVDAAAADQLSRSQAQDLAERIERADKPVFVAVLPASEEYPEQTVLQDLRGRVGTAGVYAVVRGDGFNAGADGSVMSRRAVTNLTGAVEREHGGDTAALLDDFVDQAVRQADGVAPASWGGGRDGGPYGAGLSVLVLLALLALVGVGGGLLVRRRGRRLRAERERAELDRLRPVVDEDITAFGEELRRIAFDPQAEDADDRTRADYTRALDAYDRAKERMATARRPDDVHGVSRALEEGRFALAVLEARREGRPLPEHRPPCFFDPRHGVSVADVRWAPPGGAAREVPVCAADQARLADGRDPMTRTVETPEGRRPYWEAGPVFAPWAGGYFGGALLPGLLAGTMLGGMLGVPYGYGFEGYGGTGGPEGGDFTGTDFHPGDFGGGGDLGGGGFDGGGF